MPRAFSPAAAQGTAASEGGPGALPKPPGQTITTVSGERIKDSPAFTVEDLLQESPGVNFKRGNGPRDIQHARDPKPAGRLSRQRGGPARRRFRGTRCGQGAQPGGRQLGLHDPYQARRLSPPRGST
jgi:hypothetical protein